MTSRRQSHGFALPRWPLTRALVALGAALCIASASAWAEPESPPAAATPLQPAEPEAKPNEAEAKAAQQPVQPEAKPATENAPADKASGEKAPADKAPGDEPAQKKAPDEKTAAAAPDAFAGQATWAPPSTETVRAQMLAWLDAHSPDAQKPGEQKPDAQQPDAQTADVQKLGAVQREAAVALWPADGPALSGEALLVRVAATCALVDPRSRDLIELCRKQRATFAAPEFPWLTDAATPLFERANLRLLYGRWLAQERMYEEAFAQLDGLKPEEVVDPAGLLFYQSVACHHLLKQDAAITAIKRLLERPDDTPRRYVSLARLMLADLKDLEEESLDHIARRMQDIERRLDLGRAGPKVRDVEDGVIRSLDKMIEEMEKQQQKAMAAGAGSIRSSSPAPDSRPLGGKGPGQVDKKPLGNTSGWGDLPPKQRQEALQQIGKDYPAHYRDLIEQYFRKLASENESGEP